MATFLSRRELTGRELLPAIGIGVGVGRGTGLVAAYVARLVLQRERIRGGAGAPHGRGAATTGTRVPARR